MRSLTSSEISGPGAVAGHAPFIPIVDEPRFFGGSFICVLRMEGPGADAT